MVTAQHTFQYPTVTPVAAPAPKSADEPAPPKSQGTPAPPRPQQA